MMEITLELSDPVVMQENTQCLVYSIKNFATGRPVSKTLIEYYSNNLDENDEEEKEPINIELTDQKQILIMMKKLLTLNDQV